MQHALWRLILLAYLTGTKFPFIVGAKEQPRSNQTNHRTVDGEMLVKCQGMYYLDIEKTPFNGRAISKHANGKKSYDAELQDGKPHGKVITYFEHGKKQFEAFYADGIQNGLETNWHSNGNRQLQINFQDGKRHGKMTSWTVDGIKDMEI